MALKLKPLSEQTIVITGATSGIGLTTARMAAAAGAKLVLAARGEDDLRRLEQELAGKGAQVAICPADVAVAEQVHRIAQTAIDRFGLFDTWVNDAGMSIWGWLKDIPEADHRRLFETNFWGIVNGSLEAAKHFREHAANSAYGGTIINLGSLASDQGLPLQAMYCASKHAIKGFTDALRMELADEGANISVTLIKPAGIDTPFPQHAANYMDKEPALPPPVYKPEDVATAILHAAVSPKRDIYVGSASKMFSVANRFAPRLNDLTAESMMVNAQQKDQPASRRTGTLYDSGGGLKEHGDNDGMIHSSIYTKASLHPFVTGALLGVVGVALTALLGHSQTQRSTPAKIASRLTDLV